MSSNQGDGGDSGEQSGNQTGGQGGGQPQGGQAQGGQPQAGQAPQGQPAGGQPPQGQPPAGQQPVARGPTASQKIQAAFGDYGVKNLIKAVLGTYAIIGFGIGLSVILLTSLGGAGGALLGVVGAVTTAFALGPVLGGIFGLSLSNKLPVETLPGAVVSAVVNFVGYVVMILLTALLASTQSTGFGGGVQLGPLIGPILIIGFTVAIIAGLTTALGQKVNYPATREEAEAQEPPAPRAPPQQTQQPQQP